MIPSCVLVTALGVGVLPELEAMKTPPVRGEVIFRTARPVPSINERPGSGNSGPFAHWSIDWFEDGYENLMSWDKNPWKTKFPGFGDHYHKLMESKDALDIARFQELRRLADALLKRLLARYPELAVFSSGWSFPNGFVHGAKQAPTFPHP